MRDLERSMIQNLKKQITALELKCVEARDSKGDIVGQVEIEDVVNQ